MIILLLSLMGGVSDVISDSPPVLSLCSSAAAISWSSISSASHFTEVLCIIYAFSLSQMKVQKENYLFVPCVQYKITTLYQVQTWTCSLITWQQLKTFRHIDMVRMTCWNSNWASELIRKLIYFISNVAWSTGIFHDFPVFTENSILFNFIYIVQNHNSSWLKLLMVQKIKNIIAAFLWVIITRVRRKWVDCYKLIGRLNSKYLSQSICLWRFSVI